MTSSTNSSRAGHGSMPKRRPKPAITPPGTRPSRGRMRPCSAKLWRMSSIVKALPSVGGEGFSLTPLLHAAAAARDIGCRPDPPPGSSARDPEKAPASHGDASDDGDDRGAEL